MCVCVCVCVRARETRWRNHKKIKFSRISQLVTNNYLAHQLMHIHKIVYIKTFKIAPTCFNPKIIFRELHCSSLKSHFFKSVIGFKKWDFSEEQYSSLKMILGSKHVGGILNVLIK